MAVRFGLVDVSKHGKDEAQAKALEISAALRELRKIAPQKLMQLAADEEEIDLSLWSFSMAFCILFAAFSGFLMVSSAVS